MRNIDFCALGITEYGYLSPADIPFSKEIRTICEQNVCRNYGKTYACPPAVGSFEACKQRCLSYQNAMLFCAVYPLEDSFDYEGMMAGHAAFKTLCDRLYDAVKAEISDFHLLSNEGCSRCRECTYPHAPCRFPERLFPAIEGYGINVMQLSALAGVKYIHGANTVTYFGMLLY